MINWKRPSEELPPYWENIIIAVGRERVYCAFREYDSDRESGYFENDSGEIEIEIEIVDVDFWCYQEDLIKTLPNKGE